MNRYIAMGVMVLLATTAGLWWNRSGESPTSSLAIRRVMPIGAVLKGKPNESVQVELELTNTTRHPIELVSPSMSCSCQVVTPPDKVIAAGGTSKLSLSLRYPPSRTNTVPVVFKTPNGERLGSTEIVLEADIQLPYFMQIPEAIEIPMIDGVSDHQWTTSAIALEQTGSASYVAGIRITDGVELVNASVKSYEKSPERASDCQRTYQITFDVLPSALETTADASSLRGTAVLDLNDGTTRSISWKVTRKPPLAIFFNPKSGGLKGVRRVGANGAVTLRMIPEGAGKLTPDTFSGSHPIVAQWEPGIVKPESIEAQYHGTNSVIPLLVSIPE